jgi:release factor glutamine methyltransferase
MPVSEPMTVSRIAAEMRRRLSGLYSEKETESFFRILFRRYLDMSPVQAYLSPDRELPVEAERQILHAVGELAEFRPIQYITGETEFYGLLLEVTPDVLIPRPETEEMVDWIVRGYDSGAALAIADVCTGSGCIAIALASAFSNASVHGVDISESALAVARRNALKNGVAASFLRGDVLKDGLARFESGLLDAIVSNPPYVTPAEKALMQPNVLKYEPHEALFAPDSDPLIFYRRIAAFGSRRLKNGGRIFFEINEAYHAEVADVLKKQSYSDIIPRKDINGKWRMVSATLSV